MNVLPYDWRSSAPTCIHGSLCGPLLRQLPAGAALKIADLGCGNGYIAGLMAGLGHSVTAVDSSAEGIGIAEEAHPEVRFMCVSLYEDLANMIGQDYDVIVSSDVIEHLYDPRLFLKNAYALLRPGGTIILTTPYHGYLKNLAMAFLGKLDRHFTVDWDCGHIKFFSVKTLGAMVTEQGFRDIRFSFAGRVPYLWKSMILVASKQP